MQLPTKNEARTAASRGISRAIPNQCGRLLDGFSFRGPAARVFLRCASVFSNRRLLHASISIGISEKAVPSRRTFATRLSFKTWANRIVRCKREALVSHKHCDPDARVKCVKQEILAVHIINVAVVVEAPFRRPGFDKLEVVAAINYDRLGNVDNLRPLHLESVLPTEIGTEFVVGNMLALLPCHGMLMFIAFHPLIGALVGTPFFLFLLTIATFVLFRAGLVVVALFVLLDGLVFVFVLVFLVRFGLVLFFLGLAGSCAIAVLCVNADGPCYQQQDDRHTYGSHCIHCLSPKVFDQVRRKRAITSSLQLIRMRTTVA